MDLSFPSTCWEAHCERDLLKSCLLVTIFHQENHKPETKSNLTPPILEVQLLPSLQLPSFLEPWESYLISMGLSFLIFKTGLSIVPNSEVLWGQQLTCAKHLAYCLVCINGSVGVSYYDDNNQHRQQKWTYPLVPKEQLYQIIINIGLSVLVWQAK